MDYEDKSNEYYLTLLKSKIMSKIGTNDNVILLINPKENDDLDLDDILYGGDFIINKEKVSEQGHIFDYNYVNETTTDERVFICIEALPSSYSYPLVDVLLYVHIYVHKRIMKITSKSAINPSSPTKNEMSKLGFIGNRCDMLTQAIGKVLNGVKNMPGIGGIRPYDRGYIGIDVPNSKFYGKCMIFKTKISNVELLDCEDN